MLIVAFPGTPVFLSATSAAINLTKWKRLVFASRTSRHRYFLSSRLLARRRAVLSETPILLAINLVHVLECMYPCSSNWWTFLSPPVWTKTSSGIDIFVPTRSGHIFLLSDLPGPTPDAATCGSHRRFPTAADTVCQPSSATNPMAGCSTSWSSV